MAAASESIQTIARLTPLVDVLAMLDLEVKPVTPRTLDLASAAGRILAVDAMAPSRPSAALAMLDGWALAADASLGAGNYTPALLTQAPHRVEVGQPIPVDLYAAVAAILAYLYRQRLEAEMRERRAREAAAKAQAHSATQTGRPGSGALPLGGNSQ